MPKQPFSMRVEPHHKNRYKALSHVLNMDGNELLINLINLRESTLNEKQRTAYEALLQIWKEED